MKKIVILFIAVATFASVQAQSSRDKARKAVLGQPKHTTSHEQSRTVVLGRSTPGGRVYRTNRTVYDHRKMNHGKHLGWYKGVGNPHKNGVYHERGRDEEHERREGHGKRDD
jgi:hypothetical protein